MAGRSGHVPGPGFDVTVTTCVPVAPPWGAEPTPVGRSWHSVRGSAARRRPRELPAVRTWEPAFHTGAISGAVRSWGYGDLEEEADQFGVIEDRPVGGQELGVALEVEELFGDQHQFSWEAYLVAGADADDVDEDLAVGDL